MLWPLGLFDAKFPGKSVKDKAHLDLAYKMTESKIEGLMIKKILSRCFDYLRNTIRYALSSNSRKVLVERRKIYKKLQNSPYFDSKWYIQQYPDIADSGVDPLLHYIEYGASEGRNPSPLFNTEFYLSMYPQVRVEKANPLYHYLSKGIHEGNIVQSPSFDFESSERWQESIRNRIKDTKENNNNKPLVSIIYIAGMEKSFSSAITSIIKQTYQNWELLIIGDDTGNAIKLLVSRLWKDDRIKVFHSTKSDASELYNFGLTAASGDFIAYTESNVIWSLEYIEVMLYSMVYMNSDAGCSTLRCLSSELAGQYQYTSYHRVDSFSNKLPYLDFNPLAAFMHKKESALLFSQNQPNFCEWEFILRNMDKGNVSYANFIAATVYCSTESYKANTINHSLYANIIRNKYLIDWANEARRVRDNHLVSIIICVYGQPELTDICLSSIFKNTAESIFEVILVDNGSDQETLELLEAWKEREQRISLIKNPENYNFALGNNIGFSASRGSKVIFLNNDTEVTEGWMDPLILSLDDPNIKGAQPKLLYPDGSIQGVGVVFSRRSPIAYPIYIKQPKNFPPTKKSRNYSAVTAACLAMRAQDFATAIGFDPTYINGQEDIDLCLRVGGGKSVFRYCADSIVMHNESKTKGRGTYIERNRRIFYERWKELTIADDVSYYNNDNIIVGPYVPDNTDWVDEGHAAWSPLFIIDPFDS